MHWRTTRFLIDLSRPKVMGIVNLTPDSFSDGGRHAGYRDAIACCERLIAEGADILDLGAESSRPGAQAVPLEEEMNRLLPVLRAAVTLGVPISVDTYKPEVMAAALDLGADVINDIWALRQVARGGRVSALNVVAKHPSCGICIMHMHGEPKTMQASPMAGDATDQVLAFLKAQSNQLLAAGVERSRIVWDPGVGFGKTPAQNLALLARQPEISGHGFGLLVGWSRKSTLAHVLSMGVGDSDIPGNRLVPSVVAALLAVQKGARVVRVHDVRATVQGLRFWQAVEASTA